jgi:hypothetical protein
MRLPPSVERVRLCGIGARRTPPLQPAAPPSMKEASASASGFPLAGPLHDLVGLKQHLVVHRAEEFVVARRRPAPARWS